MPWWCTASAHVPTRSATMVRSVAAWTSPGHGGMQQQAGMRGVHARGQGSECMPLEYVLAGAPDPSPRTGRHTSSSGPVCVLLVGATWNPVLR